MKAKLLTMAALCAIAFTTNAQTKGTNTLGLGVSVFDYENEYQNNKNSQKITSFSLGYGHFIADNQRIGMNLIFGSTEYESNNQLQTFKNYGLNASYQKYYPLLKTLYAYAGGGAAYLQNNQTDNNSVNKRTDREYSIGAMGGLTWFMSKRFAFETNLLAANISYSKSTHDNLSPNNIQKNTSTSFNLSTQGFVDDLGFKIYLLF
jgi:hypothetical protein